MDTLDDRKRDAREEPRRLDPEQGAWLGMLYYIALFAAMGIVLGTLFAHIRGAA